MLKQTLLAALCLTAFSCAMAADAPPGKKFEKFLVYQDKPSRNHFVASGFMPYGKCVSIDDIWQTGCHEGRSCIKSEFTRDCAALSSGWAGIYWLQPANNWGDEKHAGFNLTGAQKLVFWARGEKGGEVITFKMGGVGMGHPYPDSATATTPPITLTKDWKEYSIDLKDKDLSYIIGGFAWVGTVKENPQNATFYLDDISYQ